MNKIKIGSVDYTVEELQFIDVLGDRNCNGACNFDNTSIFILDSIGEERKKEVLMHEITHAIAHEANVEMEENAVIQFSRVLYKVLQENNFDWVKREKL